jgi:nucleoside-diphosphate-sugar epimerase
VRRVLVTGGSGFIGLPAVGQLADLGLEVHAVARHPPNTASVVWHAVDLLEPRAADEIVRRVKPSHLLHLAWTTIPGEYWTTLENLSWLAASASLLRAFAEVKGERAVFAGTCAEYEWGSDLLVESKTPLRPATLYGSCKHALRQTAESVAAQASLSVAWGRVFFLYGPREHPARLVSSVARGVLAGEVVDTTHGRQVRDFLHVTDVASAFVALLASDVTGAVNVASGEGVELRVVTAEIERLAGVNGLVRRGRRPIPPSEPDMLVGDATRLRDEVGFRRRFDLETGLADTVAWWRSQLDTSDRT